MPDENPQTGIDEALKNIDAKLKEKLHSDEEKFASLEKKLDSLEVNDEPPPQKKSWLDEGDETEFISKKDLKNMVGELKREVVDTSRSESKRLIDEITNKNSMDAKAFEEYPELDKRKKEYNPVFHKEVQGDMVQRVNRGREPHETDLLYDSATHVWSQWVKQGRTAPKHILEAENERANARQDNFGGSGSGGQKPRGLNPHQVELARKMGMSKESIEQVLEKYGKNR